MFTRIYQNYEHCRIMQNNSQTRRDNLVVYDYEFYNVYKKVTVKLEYGICGMRCFELSLLWRAIPDTMTIWAL